MSLLVAIVIGGVLGWIWNLLSNPMYKMLGMNITFGILGAVVWVFCVSVNAGHAVGIPLSVLALTSILGAFVGLGIYRWFFAYPPDF